MALLPTQQVALVTGSGRQRVGNRIARELARDGYAVAIHYRQSADEAQQTVAELEAEGGAAIALRADVTQETDVVRMFEQLWQVWGRLDVLVNTASTWSSQPLESITAQDVLHSFSVNCLGTFLCARHAGLMMVDQATGGVIINLGDASIEQPYVDHASYFVSKGAIPTLTRSLAVELASRNPRVRVNCIHPGSVMAPPDSSDEELERRREATLVKRADEPETVSHAVRFLIDNPFVTGVCLTLDGGRRLRRVDRP